MYDLYGFPVFVSSVYPVTLVSSNLMAALFLDADYKYVGGFVGAGFGVANYGVDVRYYDIDDFWTVLNRDFMRAVYKLSAGLNFNVTARTTIELGYNFIAPVSDIDIGNSFDDGNDAMAYNFSIRPHVHQISLGVRYQY
jgi:opacity protein-like surface antigen